MNRVVIEAMNGSKVRKSYILYVYSQRYYVAATMFINFYPVRMRKGVKYSVLSSLSLLSARKSPDPEFWANLRVLLIVKVSEIERKRAYVRQVCPKRTMKAINRAFCWSRLLITPIAIVCICTCHTLNARASARARWLLISIFVNDGNC